ncbi:MAG: thiamine-phosphate kinase [Candidatus Aenigmatarchaeota archaeon]|nr:MAG: thiamine-phosphate kinase [Candidatus Aenigmarchaeota archaeon]
MKILKIGEFGLIKRISRKIKDKNVLTQIGDDTAVIKIGGKFVLFTADTLVEDDHFSLKWSSPFQIGKKAMEINVSDMAAMGGEPKYALISLCLKRDERVEWVDGLYRGIYSVARKYGFEIVGGNVTHGKQTVIDVSMLGETRKPVLRSRAKVNDLICVTGDLGKSQAGLELLLKFGKKAKRFVISKSHLEPKSRLKESRIISKFAHSMIDVSDGLASEVSHICGLSRKGALINREKIPISKQTKLAAELVKKDPVDFALHGGEDFELVFTVSRKNLDKLRRKLKFSVVGKILPKSDGIYLLDKGRKRKLGKGYDHFS